MSIERELLRRISSHSESRIPAHFIYEIQELLAQPEQEPLSDEEVIAKYRAITLFNASYFAGFRDAEKAHGIGVDNE